MAPRARRNRQPALIASLRASGVVSATFHPDGTVASVVFPVVPVEVAQAKPEKIVHEPVVHPKTDLDVLTDLPVFEDTNN